MGGRLDLKRFHNRTVTITFADGEIATGRISCLEDDCDHVLVDILGTNCPEHYRDPQVCSYIVPASEIASLADENDSGAVAEPDKAPSSDKLASAA